MHLKPEIKPERGLAFHRRAFLKTTLRYSIVTVAGASLLTSCSDEKEKGEGQEVSPPEDLMQEHGLLNRILLIYDHCRNQLIQKVRFPVEAVYNAATIVRSFVEDYHEKQEENYLFPRFEKANQQTELVSILRQQHQAGRVVTEKILQLSKTSPDESGNENLRRLLADFNTMYRPHESREDTILFPAFRKIVSHHEYDALGEEFEKNEHTLFGEDGFETMVNKVANIEKSLGIYDLAQFTPHT